MSEVLDMKNFTSAITYLSPDGLTLVIPFPQPERVYGQTEYADVITKFSRFGRELNFLTHGAPLRALGARELRYKMSASPQQQTKEWYRISQL